MKKRIIPILILAIVALYLGATGVSGVMIDREIREFSETLAQYDETVQVDRLDYERGFWGGKLHYDIKYRIGAGSEAEEIIAGFTGNTPESPVAIPVQGTADVRHGPWVGGGEGFALAKTQSVWHLPEAIRSWLPDYPEDTPFFREVTTMGFNGQIRSKITGTDYDGRVAGEAIPGGVEIALILKDWGGEVIMNDRLDRLDMDIGVGTLALTGGEAGGPSGEIRLDDLACSMDTEKQTDLLWTGDGSFTLGMLSVIEDDSRMTMEKIASVFESVRNGDTFDNTLRMTAGEIDVDGIALGGARLDISLENVDILAYETFVRYLERDAAGLIEYSEEQQKKEEEIWQRFLEAGPVFRVNSASLHVVSPDDITSHLKLSYPPSAPFDPDMPDVMLRHVNLEMGIDASTDSLERLTRIYAEIESRQHEKLFGQPMSAEMIDETARRSYQEMMLVFHFMPFFQVSADGVSSHLEIKDGMIVANGQQVMDVKSFLDSL